MHDLHEYIALPVGDEYIKGSQEAMMTHSHTHTSLIMALHAFFLDA